MKNRISFLVVFCGLIASASAQSNFNRYTFNAGGGLGVGRHEVADFVGESLHGVVGGGINFTRMFGADAEYMYYNLGLRPSVSQNQSLPDASGHMQSVSLDGIVNAPLHGKWGAYGIFGIGFYRRSVSAHSMLLQPDTICPPAWSRWWGIECVQPNPINPPVVTFPPQQTLSSFSRDAGGFNYGGGVTRRLTPHLKLYLEGRYHKAYHADGQTIVFPITVGVRW